MSRTAIAICHVVFEDVGVWRDTLVEEGYGLSYVEAGVDKLAAEALLSADLLIVLGGPIGVYETDAYPFLVEEVTAIRRRLESNRPILGVCLGAQLMAAALGARVAPGPGKEIGYAPVELTPAGRASPLARLEGAPVLHWHGDNCDLPPGGELLASTPLCPSLGVSGWAGGARPPVPCRDRPAPVRSLARRPRGRTRKSRNRSVRHPRRRDARGRLHRGGGARDPVGLASGAAAMSFADAIGFAAEAVGGRISYGVPLAPYTWFRVGGAAEALFLPADEDDLAVFLSRLPEAVPVTVIGFGSNLIVRDGGIEGVVIRLGGRTFNAIDVMKDFRIVVGAAAPDQFVAKAAAGAGVDGLAFLRGVPGSIGGALRMNAGAHGGEIRDVLVEVRGVDRCGATRVFSNAAMGFSYRHSSVPDDVILSRATFQGRRGDPDAILAEMERITRAREETQPIREKTGGSTFKNPPGGKAWRTHRRGRLPRTRDRRRPGVDHALQLPDQSGRRDRRRHRGARRRGAAARAREKRR